MLRYLKAMIAGTALLAVAGMHALPAVAESVVIGGTELSCPNTRIVMDIRAPGAMSLPGRIILNPDELDSMDPLHQRIMFLHECGHQFVGDSELGADCWAVREAKQQGWLNRGNFEHLCRMVSALPGGPEHPPGRRRCDEMRRCFAVPVGSFETASITPQRTPRIPSPRPMTAPAPQLVLPLTRGEAQALVDLSNQQPALFAPSFRQKLREVERSLDH